MLKSLGFHLVADAGALEIHIDECEIVLASLLMNTQIQPKTQTLSTEPKVKDNCKSHFVVLSLFSDPHDLPLLAHVLQRCRSAIVIHTKTHASTEAGQRSTVIRPCERLVEDTVDVTKIVM